MNKLKKIITTIALSAVVVTGLAACSGASDSYTERTEKQQTTTLTDSIALDNLEKKRDLENDPNKVRYIYLMNFGQIVGYYVSVGNITSNASQMAPEDDIVDPCSSTYCPTVVDSAADDGTYGAGDPGIFFFTADGTMVVTSLDYIQSDQPLQIDVPRLGGE